MGCYGSSSDLAFFKQSKLGKLLRENKLHISADIPEYPFVFVGDKAFGIGTYLMQPYSQWRLKYAKQIFNYRISRARRMVECTFRILANKWHLLDRSIQMELESATNVIKACCVLHNYVRERGGYNFEDSLCHGIEQV